MLRRLTRYGIPALLLLSGCTQPQQGGIAAGTTHVAAVLQGLSEEPIRVYTLIPGGMCPGHFDMRPGDLERVISADLLVIQPWQREAGNMKKVIQAAALPETRIRVVDVPGNWMVPEVQMQAVKVVADVLCEWNPAGAEQYRRRAADMDRHVSEVAAEVRSRLKPVSGRVACNEMQEPFICWAGLDIAVTFGRMESASAAELDRLVTAAKAGKVALVVDNLQSGDTKTGAMIARECGAGHLVLSNFPGGFEDTDTWEKAFRKNAELLLNTLQKKVSPDE